MSLRHILLGLLTEPATGYELKKRFEGSLNHFWRAELSQIYPTLHTLAGEGLLECRSLPPKKGPGRRTYARTKRGDQELRRWLQSGPALLPPRYAFLAQTFFLDQLPNPGDAERFLIAFRDECRRRRSVLKWIRDALRRQKVGSGTESCRGDFFRTLTLLNGLAVISAHLRWSEGALARLRRRSWRTQASSKRGSCSTGGHRV
jgi:PadR family transcriptional regulator AphA